ncbi:MAG: DUF4340 domain-containing protein [Gammaproteobacteria bacterium]
MKRAQLNLALLAVAAGLGVAVYFAQQQAPAGPPLTAYKPDAVTRISLEHPNAPAIRLEKQGGQWQLVAPVTTAADPFEVNGLVALADRETRHKVDSAALKDLDLEPPQFTLTLNDAAIGFGATEPLEFRRYVTVGGTAYLVDDPPGAALDKDYSDLVAKDLFPAGAEIERIEVPGLTLARDVDGKWVATPADPKATTDAMQKFADGWKGARSMWNELSPAKLGGDVVKVTLKGGVTREFVVAEREPQLKLVRVDLGVTLVLSKALADELLKLPEPAPEKP